MTRRPPTTEARIDLRTILSAGVDYTTIQAAVDAAGDGDTIEVRGGVYVENVDVYKQLTLIGDGADVVTVRAAFSGDNVFEVTSNYVNISGFTVTGAAHTHGIYLYKVYHCNISENTASDNQYGIRLSWSSDNTLVSNTASNKYGGIALYSSSNNTLVSNTANSNDDRGIFLYYYSSNNTLTDNTASNNDYGIYLYSSNNYIYRNALTYNTNHNAYDECTNQWDNGAEGNYYSDYTGMDVDRNGIGDDPYPIPGGSSVDNYPLYIPKPNRPPVVSFTYSPQHPFVYQEITFDASESYDPYGPYDGGEIVSYEWDFGDGNTTTGIVVHHTYSTFDDYMVNLTVTDDDGGVSNYTEYIPLSMALAEDIDLTVSKTQDHLDGVMDEVQWCAEDGDYFAEKLEGDMRDMLVDYVADTIGVFSEIPGDDHDLHKIAFAGDEDTIYTHLSYLKHNNEYASNLFRDALLNRNFDGAGEVLKGASYYFAADFADESIDEITVEAFKISYKLNLEGDLAMQEKFVPAVENAIERVYKTDLDDTKSSVLQNILEFTSDEIELYEEDLTKRRHANLYLIDHLKRQNLMLHHTQDIAESEEGDWEGKIYMFAAKYGVRVGMWFLFDGPGVLVTELAGCAWNVYENRAELDTDAQMMELAIASNNNAFDTSRRIYTNTLRGLKNIENGVTPQIARGNIESIDNLVLAEYVFWGENNYAFVTDTYSEVTINNTGTSTTDYLLTAKYGVWGLLGTSYTPMTVPAALKIGAGGTNTIRVKYYEDGKYGECPSDGTYIQFDLLGQTDTGLYYVGTSSTNFYPHIPYTISTKFGTTKIVTSKDSILSQEEMDGAEMRSYPVRSVVKTPINSTNYTLEIYVENPFDVPISVTLSQEMPNDTEIIDACGGTIDENIISWNMAIEPEGYYMITVIFTSHNAPGVKVEVPPVEMGIYDPINENMVDFQTNLYEFETKFPLRIMAFPPTNASIGEEIIVPINITSLSTDDPFSGNIILELVNSDNDTIYSLTEGFSLAPGETHEINLVASPEIDHGIYIIKGTLQGTEASMNIFKEYISVDACYVIGTVLLQNRYNHNGTEVKLGNYNATTQPAGSYTFVGIPVGTYSLTILHSGYLDYAEVVTVYEGFNIIPEITLVDITPPASITNLNPTTDTTWINWTWTNPPDTDFNHTMIYLNGTWQTNTSDPFHNAAGLSPNASYEIGTHTVDTSGNVNTTWVNRTAKVNQISTWYLHNNSAMYRTTTNPTDNLTIATGSSNLWIADEPAQTNLTFPAGVWTGRITLETALTSGQNFSIEVGNCSGGNFTASGSDTINGDGNTTFDVRITADSFSISTDDYLAVNITNATTDLEVKTGGAHSHITAPDNAPAYPVPELSSVLFVSIALIALAGVLLINSRRSAEK